MKNTTINFKGLSGMELLELKEVLEQATIDAVVSEIPFGKENAVLARDILGGESLHLDHCRPNDDPRRWNTPNTISERLYNAGVRRIWIRKEKTYVSIDNPNDVITKMWYAWGYYRIKE